MAEKPILVRPDYNTDVLWKPPRLGNRTRTISTDSNDSEASLTAAQAGGRRFSLSEYFSGAFHRKGSVDSAASPISPTDVAPPKKLSITEKTDFQELLRRQKRILED